MLAPVKLLQLALLILYGVFEVSCIKLKPGGNRPPKWHTSSQVFRRGRSLMDFDPTVTSLGYCKPKTYPADDKRLPTIKFNTPVTDLKWAHSKPYLDKIVYALLESETGFGGGRVWRSTQYGDPNSWEDITDKMSGAFGESQPAEESGVMALHYHTDRTEKVFFQGAGTKNWIQEAADKDYEAVDSPGGTRGLYMELKLHPTQKDWMLSKVLRSHCQTHGNDRWCAYDVFLSKDYGRTWQNLTANSRAGIASFIDFDWGVRLRHDNGQGPAELQDETIFATVYEKPEFLPDGGPFGRGWDPNVHFVMSHDFFTSGHKTLVQCGNMFEVISHKVFLALPSRCPFGPDGKHRDVPSDVTADQVTLYVSNDDGFTFQEVCLPTSLEDKGYNLVRTHDSESVFLVIDHDEEDNWEASLPIGNVYSAGINNTALYSLSLRRNFRRGSVVDFVRVEGMPGTYLANQLADSVVKSGGQLGKDVKLEKYVQTKVSFNNGARWREVQGPDRFRHVECNNCAGTAAGCKLHLHGPTSWFWTADMRPSPSLYTHENAPGIVLATGNTGEYLDTSGDRTCTWMSQDGGQTWEDIANHAAMYEFGDHGNIVIVSSFMTRTPTDKVFFSIDDGHCFNTIQLEEAIFVENIRVEPQGASHIFFVHGVSCYTDEHERCSTASGEERKGRLIPVDIRELKGQDEYKTCEKADYEEWQPPTGCLLGRNYSMERQIWDHYCFNPVDYERPKMTWKDCDCTAEDFGCEFGYEDDGNGGCKQIEGLDSRNCAAMHGYVASHQHKRLVHGDSCTGPGHYLADGSDGAGHKWDSASGKSIPGPSSGSSSSSISRHWWALLLGSLLGVAVVTVAGFFWWKRMASEYTKASLEDCFSPLVSCCGGLFGSVSHRMAGMHAARKAQEEFFQPLDGPVGLELGEEDKRTASLVHSQ